MSHALTPGTMARNSINVSLVPLSFRAHAWRSRIVHPGNESLHETSMKADIRSMNPAGTDTLPRLHRSGNEGHLILRDGRALHFMEFGRPDGVPAFGFHGTPGSRFMFRLADPAASRLGLRLIAPERPGFGLSSFQKRRKLSDWASDMRELADALGIDRFAVA